MSRWLTIILVAGTLACLAFAGGREAQAQPASPDRPNVLFIAVDDLNDWTGYLGGHPQAQTPNIDRLAESGLVFTHAYPPGPVCGPSRTALLYGRYPHETGAYGNNDFYSPRVLDRYARSTAVPDVFRHQKSLPTAFRENGYHTAGAGKLSHFTQTPRFSEEIASYFKDDFDVYFDSPTPRIYPDPDHPATNTEHLPFGPVTPEEEDQLHDTQYADWATEQLQKDYDQPFFLAVGFRKPHLPWVAPESYFDKFDLEDIQLPNVPDDDLEDIPQAGKIFAQSLFFYHTMYPETDHQTITRLDIWKENVRAYLASSSYADAMVGRVLEALEESPHADNTIVVLWGDHGWHLGEKKHWRKMTLWETGTRTPLIIRRPGAPANGQAVGAPVSLQDLYPTLVELADLQVDQQIDGNSLVPLLEEPGRAWEKPVLMTHGPGNFSVRSGPWDYIRYQNGDEELYNVEEDPQELKNLAGEPGYEDVVDRLEQHVPREYVELYDHRALQFANLDTMEVFVEARAEAAGGMETASSQARPDLAIERVIDRLWQALSEQDQAAFARHVSDDWRLYSAGGSKLDIDALFDFHTAHIEDFALEKSNVEVHRAGDMAWVTYEAALSGRRDGEAWGGDFLMTNIFRRQGGRWVGVHMHESKQPSE